MKSVSRSAPWALCCGTESVSGLKAECRMTKEMRMTNECRSPKAEMQKRHAQGFGLSCLVLPSSFGFRHSAFFCPASRIPERFPNHYSPFTKYRLPC
jgi:hypothetical protein